MNNKFPILNNQTVHIFVRSQNELDITNQGVIALDGEYRGRVIYNGIECRVILTEQNGESIWQGQF